MTTRNLLSGPITLSDAKWKSSNVLHALGFPQQERDFYARIERQRHLLTHLVAHHLNINPASVTISGQKHWLRGSFNLRVRLSPASEGGLRLDSHIENAKQHSRNKLNWPLPSSGCNEP